MIQCVRGEAGGEKGGLWWAEGDCKQGVPAREDRAVKAAPEQKWGRRGGPPCGCRGETLQVGGTDGTRALRQDCAGGPEGARRAPEVGE